MSDVESNITFILKQKNKPYYDSSAITGLVPKLYFKVEKKKVLISNARNIINTGFEKSGYEVCKLQSKYNDVNLNDNIDNYKNEICAFLKKKFNYIDIFIFDLTRRSNSKSGAENNDGFRQPAERAHLDYTKNSGKRRAKEILGKSYFTSLINNNKRIIQLNLWRPLCKTVLSSPLAFAMPSTICKKDLIATDQRFPDRTGEIYHLAYNKNQKWLWVPKMNNNEVLLLKNWESYNNTEVSNYAPHTSFNLKGQNIKKYPRDSIEARVFLVLKNEK